VWNVSTWISGPSFDDFAQRVEQGMASLTRKIDFARRLDTSLGRRAIVLGQDVPPTRIALVDRELDAAAETLMRDQLADQDWVYVQQHLEAADKLLHEPTQDEKDAFQALLVQRWKSIAEFFGTTGLSLTVPPSLAGMESAFPTEECLPKKGDTDGSQWVADAGRTRADLQLGALEILRDYLFLAPASGSDRRWTKAKDRLTVLCGTPSIENLAAARLVVRELAEGIDVDRILEALRAGEAAIDVSPQTVRTNEKARFSLKFKDPVLNTAAARQSVLVEWSFQPRPGKPPEPGASETPAGSSPQSEHGWEIYHYFTEDVAWSEVRVQFYVNGELVTKLTQDGQPDGTLLYPQTIRPQVRALDTKDWLAAHVGRIFPEALQLAASLLVPLATLAVTQSDQGASGRWWELVGVGFGSEAIRAILTGKQSQSGPPAQPTRQS
jgi:hypothetical protein